MKGGTPMMHLQRRIEKAVVTASHDRLPVGTPHRKKYGKKPAG
jgi:hypothetical protein